MIKNFFNYLFTFFLFFFLFFLFFLVIFFLICTFFLLFFLFFFLFLNLLFNLFLNLILDISLTPCIIFLLSQFQTNHCLIDIILICNQCIDYLLFGKIIVKFIENRFNNDLIRSLFLWFLFFQLTNLLFLFFLKNHFRFLNRSL